MKLLFLWIKFYIEFFIYEKLLGKSHLKLQINRFNKRNKDTFILWYNPKNKEYFLTDHSYNKEELPHLGNLNNYICFIRLSSIENNDSFPLQFKRSSLLHIESFKELNNCYILDSYKVVFTKDINLYKNTIEFVNTEEYHISFKKTLIAFAEANNKCDIEQWIIKQLHKKPVVHTFYYK